MANLATPDLAPTVPVNAHGWHARPGCQRRTHYAITVGDQHPDAGWNSPRVWGERSEPHTLGEEPTTKGTTMEECDFCEAEFEMQDRWVAATPRPSDPSHLVAIMWGCPPCGPKHGLLSPEAIDAIEDGMTGEGPVVPGYEGMMFITV